MNRVNVLSNATIPNIMSTETGHFVIVKDIDDSVEPNVETVIGQFHFAASFKKGDSAAASMTAVACAVRQVSTNGVSLQDLDGHPITAEGTASARTSDIAAGNISIPHIKARALEVASQELVGKIMANAGFLESGLGI